MLVGIYKYNVFPALITVEVADFLCGKPAILLKLTTCINVIVMSLWVGRLYI